MKPSGDGRCKTGSTEVRRSDQLRPKQHIFSAQGLLWGKRLMRGFSPENSIPLTSTESHELSCDDELQLGKLSIDLSNLIVESRTPGINDRGYGEGVHCPPVFGSNNHRCNPSSLECQQHQLLIQRLLHGKKYPSFDIEVILVSECCQKGQDYKFRDKVLNKEYLLLERWTMNWCFQCSVKPVIDVGQLYRAVRSFLHFSQLSAWLSLHKGKSPSNIYYWVKVPGENLASKFDSKPEVHIFPTTQISENIAATVRVYYRPRTQCVPIIPCVKHIDINQNISQDFISTASSSQIIPLKLCTGLQFQHAPEPSTTITSNCAITNVSPLILSRALPPASVKNVGESSRSELTMDNSSDQGVYKENKIHSQITRPKNSDESDQLSVEIGITVKSHAGTRKDTSSQEEHSGKRKRRHTNLSQETKGKVRKPNNSKTELTIDFASKSSDGENSANIGKSNLIISQEKESSQVIPMCCKSQDTTKLCDSITNPKYNEIEFKSCSNDKADCLSTRKRKPELIKENSDTKPFSSQIKYKETKQIYPKRNNCTVFCKVSKLSVTSANKNDEIEDCEHIVEGKPLQLQKVNHLCPSKRPQHFDEDNILKPRVLRDVKNTSNSILHKTERLSLLGIEVDRIDVKCDVINTCFNQKSGELPLPSSPIPERRCLKSFNYAVLGKKRLFEETAKKIIAPNSQPPKLFKGRKLLGNFEESILNGCLQPVSSAEGFKSEIGASGSFCPDHLTLPVNVQFYELNSFHRGASPYLGHVFLENVEYYVPKKGAVQVTLFNPSGTVVKMFVVNYDLTNMPPMCHTFMRQRTFYMPIGASVQDPSSKAWLRYVIHLRFASSAVGKIFLHRDIKILIMNKSDVDAASIHSEKPYELCSFTEMPTNPSFSLCNDQNH